MLSIVICSVSSEKLSAIRKNIDSTIGVEYEIIAIDNRGTGNSITEVYNRGARQAKYPYLLFVHEDVTFLCKGWGRILEEKLSQPDCGVIGYAGSRVMMDCFSGWYQDTEWQCLMLYQGLKTGESELRTDHVYRGRPFEEVITLDGLALFVRKEVWAEFLFDEENLHAFHCYDVDFSLRVAASGKYRNYVCASLEALVNHSSEGNLNYSWYKDTVRMCRTVWKPMLPIKVRDFALDSEYARKRAESLDHYFLRRVIDRNYPEKTVVMKDFLSRYPFTAKHIGHCLTDIPAYVLSFFRGKKTPER